MTTQIPMTVMIPAPFVLRVDEMPPEVIATTRLKELCKQAEIPCHVTGANCVVFVHGDEHHYRTLRTDRGDPIYYVSYPPWDQSRLSAFKVLEILAFSFHDYGTRECICRHNYYSAELLP